MHMAGFVTMEIEEETQHFRERALHLAAEVAETDDSNVPLLLLRLKGTFFSDPLLDNSRFS